MRSFGYSARAVHRLPGIATITCAFALAACPATARETNESVAKPGHNPPSASGDVPLPSARRILFILEPGFSSEGIVVFGTGAERRPESSRRGPR